MINGYVILGAVLLVGAITTGAYVRGHANGTEKAKLTAKVAMDAHLAADSKAAEVRKEEVRKLEFDLLDAQTEVAESYEKGKRDAEAIGEAVAAGLRAGNLQLRNRWTSCKAAQRLPGTPAGPPELDAAVGDREESAARIVRAAVECDAQVQGLQDLLTRERVQMGRPRRSSRR